jgi:hypothetical protein
MVMSNGSRDISIRELSIRSVPRGAARRCGFGFGFVISGEDQSPAGRVIGNRLRVSHRSGAPSARARIGILGERAPGIIRRNIVTGLGPERRGRGEAHVLDGGIWVTGGIFTTSRHMHVSGNVIRNANEGIVVDYGAYSPTLSYNIVQGFGDTGIYLDYVQRGDIHHNDVRDTTGVGLYVEADDRTGDGLAFLENVIRGSGRRDCVDTSRGAGTARTNNDWVGNAGSRSSPAGICSKPQPTTRRVPERAGPVDKSLGWVSGARADARRQPCGP